MKKLFCQMCSNENNTEIICVVNIYGGRAVFLCEDCVDRERQELARKKRTYMKNCEIKDLENEIRLKGTLNLKEEFNDWRSQYNNIRKQ